MSVRKEQARSRLLNPYFATLRMALGDAQLLSIRKLLSNAISEANDFDTPGPPLPKGHPSASLLAKLYLSVAEHYTRASALAKTVSSKRPSSSSAFSSHSATSSSARAGASHAAEPFGGDAHEDRMLANKASGRGGKLLGKLKGKLDSVGSGGSGGSGSGSGSNAESREVGAALIRYLAASSAVANALAHKWLGIDAGENREQYGEAIAHLRIAQASISSESGGGRRIIGASSSSSNGKASRAELKVIQEQEAKNIEHWLTSYTKLNDSLAFQPVPPSSDVLSKIPAGRAALTIKPFLPPRPLFGPGAEGYVPRSGAEPGPPADHDALDERLRAVGLHDAGVAQPGKYAGANAYY